VPFEVPVPGKGHEHVGDDQQRNRQQRAGHEIS
jgi:hypothetical protein